MLKRVIGMISARRSRAGGSSASRRVGRYTVGARGYDRLSVEGIYRPGRQAGIELLGLQPGDRVLDIGCGTGLNFALLEAAVGPTGTIIGVDLSAQMLAVAHARIRGRGWMNVCLVQGNAATCYLGGLLGSGPVDAALFTYALSVIADGPAAWQSARAATRPGGRVAVVDLALPTGRWAVLAPAARLACLSGGVDLARAPWRWVARELSDVEQRRLRGGYVRVAAGTVPPRTDQQAAH